VPRRFRWFGKKRGQRRTASGLQGNYGEAAFFGALFVIGTIGSYLLLAKWILPEWQANQRFEQATGQVVETRVGSARREGVTLYRPEVLLRYEIGGSEYARWTYDANWAYSLSEEGARSRIEQFQEGSNYRFWYDPANPENVVLVRGYSWWMWLLLIVPASFMIAGGVGGVLALLESGTSVERRAAIAQKAPRLDLLESSSASGSVYPTLPSPTFVTDSPGTHLAYRLPVEAATGWQVAGMASITALWVVIVAILAIENVWSYVRGDASVGMTLILLPLFGIGLGLVYFTGKQFFLSTGPGQTRLEISAHPLYPGERYELYIGQTGRLHIESLSIELLCEEQATYRQGTDTRSERRCVYRQEVYRRGQVEIAPGDAFEDTCSFDVPESAMHSFHGTHNEIKWRLVVAGRLRHTPDYERAFPIVVYPPQLRSPLA